MLSYRTSLFRAPWGTRKQVGIYDPGPFLRIYATCSFLLLVVWPGATSSALVPSRNALVTSSFLLLVVWPGVTSSFLLLVVWPGATSSVLAPSRNALVISSSMARSY